MLHSDTSDETHRSAAGGHWCQPELEFPSGRVGQLSGQSTPTAYVSYSP